jgi:nucleoid DNA-binding protein
MSPLEIVALIKNANPKLLADVQDKRAARVIREAWLHVVKQIEATDEGVVKVPGLGAFQVRQVKQEKEGAKATVRRVIFKAAKPGKAKPVKSASKKSAE